MAFEIGLRVGELYDLTPREFQNAVKGYTNRQKGLFTFHSELTKSLQAMLVQTSMMANSDKKRILNLLDKKEEQPDTTIKPKSKAELQKIWEKIDRQRDGVN